MLQNHTWVKALFKAQDRPMKFNRKDSENLIDLVLDFTLQETSMKSAFVKFRHSMKEYPQFPENAIKTL